MRMMILMIAILSAAPARAVDQGILGSSFLVKGKPDAKGLLAAAGKEPSSPSMLMGDPIANGATLTFIVNGWFSAEQTFSLPAGTTHWRALSGGFQYSDPQSLVGPVKRVLLKRTSHGTFTVKARVKGESLTVAPPYQGTDGGMIVTLLGGGDRYCVSLGGPAGGIATTYFGGQGEAYGPVRFKITPATAEPGCPTLCGRLLATVGSGELGSDPGDFDHAIGVAVDADDDLYVADVFNHRIQKFDSSGGFLTEWGTQGAGDGQFLGPIGVAVDGAGNVYVLDQGNHRIQKFTANGTFLTKWGSQGSADGQFQLPHGIAVTPAGTVYVSDTGNVRVQKFDADGTFLGTWGVGGSGDGEFQTPAGLAVDASGNVYVADMGNHSVQKFDADGTFLARWGSTQGTGLGQFNVPSAVGIDPGGAVYVADDFRVQKFDGTGTLLRMWGYHLSELGAVGLAVDSSGSVYVGDAPTSRVVKFACP